MPDWRKHGPLLALGAGVLLLGVALVLALTLRGHSTRVVTVTVPVTGRTTTSAQPPATTATTPAPAPPPPSVPMSWDAAGGLVWHSTDVDPTWLGQQMRAAGFGWVAVYLGGPTDPATPDADWLARFRAASGLPIGGWSVLGTDPAADASRAASLIGQAHLDFYIADAEAAYGYTQGATHSATRLARSRAFVTAFRRAEPALTAALSSYCRPDQHDLDWGAWATGHFVFLPQAYVNDFGDATSPASCVAGAAHWFPKSEVHPTVGSYAGTFGFVSPQRYVELLAQAGTTGFSIFPAEVAMPAESWQAYGAAIASGRLAKKAG